MNVQSLKIDRTAGRRSGRARRSPWFGRVVALAIVAGMVWLFWNPLTDLVDRFRLPQVRVQQVIESHPAAAGAMSGTAANGHVVAARRAALSADTPGRIVELNVTEGSVVRKGDVVARLYSAEYEASLRRAEAELAAANVQVRRASGEIDSAKAELAQRRKSREAAHEDLSAAKADHDLAVEEFERTSDLLEKGDSSQSDFDAAKANLDSTAARQRAAGARLSAADAAVALAQSRLSVETVDLEAAETDVKVKTAARDLAKATLDKTEVRAPFDGIVVLKDAEVGEVVSPNSQGGSNARGSVCTMVDLDSLEAQAEVHETSLSSVDLGGPATIYLDAYPDHPYAGRVDRIWPTADRQKGIVEVRIAFDVPDELLRPQMAVRIVFAPPPEQTDAQPAILISQDTIVEIDGGSGVFVLERDTVRFAPVELGERRGGRIAVRGGLEPGQTILIDPPASLQSGDRVRIEKS